MKNIIITALLLLTGIAARAQFTEVHIQASGLTCAMCAKSIFKNLQTLSFAEKIETDLNTSTFVIIVKPGASVDPDQVRKKVEEAGFAVAAMQLKGKFEKTPIAGDGHLSIGGNTYHFLGEGSKELSADATLVLVDKSFVTDKDFKKYSKLTKMECYKTGMAGECCEKEGVAPKTRIYHVTI